MVINWHTKNINIQDYYKIIRNTIYFNSNAKYWKKFKKNWTIHVMPADNPEEYKRFFGHIPNIKFSKNIAWGITGKREMYLFVVDSRNPFITRSNAMPIGHELLHAIYQDNVGTTHIKRRHTSPEGRAGTRGAAATVIVHDNWYGTQETMKFWIGWGAGWLPITIPFIPLRRAKRIYKV